MRWNFTKKKKSSLYRKEEYKNLRESINSTRQNKEKTSTWSHCFSKKKKKEIMEKWKNKWCQKTEYAWVIPVSKRKWEGLAFFTFHVITSAYEVVM